MSSGTAFRFVHLEGNDDENIDWKQSFRGKMLFYKITDEDLSPRQSYNGTIVAANTLFKPFEREITVIVNIDKKRAAKQRQLNEFLPEVFLKLFYYDSEFQASIGHVPKSAAKDCILVSRVKYKFLVWYEDKLKSWETNDGDWFTMVKTVVYNLCRMLTTWLRLAIKDGHSHSNLLNCIYLLDDETTPCLLVSKTYNIGADTVKGDMCKIKHIIYCVSNHFSVEDLNSRPGIQYGYDNFNVDVPEGIRLLIENLNEPTLLDKYLALEGKDKGPFLKVLFDPAFLWGLERRIDYLDNAHDFIRGDRSRSYCFSQHGKWSWKETVENAPENNFVKIYWNRVEEKKEEARRKGITGKYKYGDNASLLQFVRNAKWHMKEEFDVPGHIVVEQFEALLGVSSKVQRSVKGYFMDETGKAAPKAKQRLLALLGYKN